MKILTILGARPQFVKASVVSPVIAAADGLEEIVVHTGQHFDANMSQVFFTELGMAPPSYHMGIRGGSHGDMTGRMLIEIEKILLSVKPDIVLVYGDTNSTLAGALAAAKLNIPVAHVEAGLRSFNMRMPEEVNRILTDRISHWLFAPTEVSVANLRNEGVVARVQNVGDVMYDVVLRHGERSQRMDSGLLERLGLNGQSYVLATIHRAENTDVSERMRAIVEGLALACEEMPVVWPVHPRTRAVLERLELGHLARKINLIEPVGYLDMILLERNAAVIVTDSGGVQKEAFFHQVPCVTLRDETEWVELVEAGWNWVVPPVSPELIDGAIRAALGKQGMNIQPYGDGHAAERIVGSLRAGISS